MHHRVQIYIVSKEVGYIEVMTYYIQFKFYFQEGNPTLLGSLVLQGNHTLSWNRFLKFFYHTFVARKLAAKRNAQLWFNRSKALHDCYFKIRENWVGLPDLHAQTDLTKIINWVLSKWCTNSQNTYSFLFSQQKETRREKNDA